MGKLGRFACILTPMLLTLASLLCGLIILISGTKHNIGAGFYFFRLNTQNVTTPSSLDLISGTSLDDNLVSTGFNGSLNLQDFYTSYLWNYCGGNITTSGDYDVVNCTSPSAKYAFNIEDIVGNTTNGSSSVNWPSAVTKAQKGVNVAEKAMLACYLIGFAATCATFIIGWFGLLSRWGSCVTTIIADAAFFFLLIASIIATAMFYSLKTAFNKALSDDFNVTADVGKPMMTLTWLAVAFSFGASFFWMLSTCCCSGRTSRVMDKGASKKGNPAVQHAPYSYERVASPYMGTTENPGPAPVYGQTSYGQTPYGQTPYGQNVEMSDVHHQQGKGYEPMRHTAV